MAERLNVASLYLIAKESGHELQIRGQCGGHWPFAQSITLMGKEVFVR